MLTRTSTHQHNPHPHPHTKFSIGFLVTVILGFIFGIYKGVKNNEFARPHMRAFHFSWCVGVQGPSQQAFWDVVLVSCLIPSLAFCAPTLVEHLSVSIHRFSFIPQTFLMFHRFSFHLAFLGWFAFAPLMSIIAPQVGKVSEDGAKLKDFEISSGHILENSHSLTHSLTHSLAHSLLCTHSHSL